MTEREFNELRRYREAEGQCISDWDSARPYKPLVSRGWVREVVRDCWGITEKGVAAFDAVVSGDADYTPDREGE